MLINGPEGAATLVLAHGAGAAMDSDFMNQLAEGLGGGRHSGRSLRIPLYGRAP